MSPDQKLLLSGVAFTPSTPIDERRLFSGRPKQVDRVVNSIILAGQHAILYGERGVGKTSLASVIHAFLPQTNGIINIRVNCDADTTFTTLFRNILKEIKLAATMQGVGFNNGDKVHIDKLTEDIEENGIDPNTLRFTFRQLSSKVIIIIDEFDRVTDDSTKRLLADTIKNFSDYKVDTTFILVGIADSVDDLIAEHQSVERALVQVFMPRMTTDELNGIIDNGLRVLDMQIDDEARERIIKLSQGLPHYTHLLSFHAVQTAIRNNKTRVDVPCIIEATSRAIEMSQESVKDSYFKAVNSPRGNMYQEVLLACALAEGNEMGYFAATDVKVPIKKITGKAYEVSTFALHLQQFCTKERGPILKRVGVPRRYRYRFLDPLLAPFVVMKGLEKGQLAIKDLK